MRVTTKPFLLFDTWNAAPSAGIDRTVMLRLLIDQGLEMFVQLTVRERDRPDKLGRLLADYASNPIKLCRVSVTSLIPLVNVHGDKKDYAL